MPLGMLGKYEKLDVLGHGASGIVFLAKDTLLNRQVALKVVNLQAGDMQHFLEEARVLDRLRHPHIVRVHNVDRIDGNIVLDMEYVRGKNVQEMLREQGPLPEEYALEIAAQTLDALEYAHQMQTVHRDIKPANILISRQGEVKLVDFGLAEILATNAYAGGAGTYAYMAPEDFAEENRSDHQSDIWAVGVTLYEMLAGQRPFQVSRPKDPFAWKRVLDNDLPTPLVAYLPGASAELQAVLNRALAKEKNHRYATAAAFRDDLRRLQAGQTLDSRTLDLDPDPTGLHTVPSKGTQNGHTSGRQRLPAANSLSAGSQSVRAATLTQINSAQAASAGTGSSSRRSAPARQSTGGSLLLSANAADFGRVHQGETREVKIMARLPNAQGLVSGRVLQSPSWVTVQPSAFDRAKQTLTLTAHSARTAGLGDASGVARIEVDGSIGEIPVRIHVLKARPAFVRIAAWFVPLFAASLLPVASVLYVGGGANALSHPVGVYVPAAAAASCLLSVMLLLIGFAVDIGLAERLACALSAAAMGCVLGATSAHWQSGAQDGSFERAVLTAAPIGGMLILQLLSLKKWRWWAFVIVCAGLGIGGGFLYQLK